MKLTSLIGESAGMSPLAEETSEVHRHYECRKKLEEGKVHLNYFCPGGEIGE